MKWNNVKDLQPEAFRRLTGIKRTTFDKMIEILTEAHAKKKAQGGRPSKLYPTKFILRQRIYENCH